MSSPPPVPAETSHDTNRRPVVVGVTGASGSILGLRLLFSLLQQGIPTDVIFTEKAVLVMQSETGFSLGGGTSEEKASRLAAFLQLAPQTAERIRCFPNHNVGAPPASGTYLHQGMVITPCSMGTLAKIAAGFSDSLITRAADVTLKEARKLILVPRETPLNAIHLENMLKLSRLGVRIIPPMLAFYQPEFMESIEGQLAYATGKVLDHLDLPHALHSRWGQQPFPAAP